MHRILVIDDEAEIRHSVIEVLRTKNYDIVSAADGRSGVEMARQFLPDLIICDIQMPYLNGYDVLVQLRSDPNTMSIPFIFLTALGTKDHVRQGMSFGADDYLTKPFRIRDLFDAVEARLRRKETSTRQMDDLKLQLSRMLPHELRTPLSVILGYSQFLSDPQFFSVEKVETLHMAQAIYQSGMRLQRLIENYLFFTDLKLYEDHPEFFADWQIKIPTRIKELITVAVCEIAQKQLRSADLMAHLAENEILLCERATLKIIQEIVDNAFKFSPQNTKVDVTATVAEDTLVITVQDHGRGMTEGQVSHLNAFTQFDRQLHEQAGSGLGLAIADRLTRLNQGQMHIQSQLNVGTIVRITFPVTN